tara:strand:- start:1605 stop:2321 length:717 start_codon:yes stop_codon:yes gene_type:complete
MKKKSIVIVPTYNEILNIEKLIFSIMNVKNNFDVLVVDDNSPDKTFVKVSKLREKFNNRLFLLLRKKKEGLGKAYLEGFNWAIKKKYDYIFQMDGDFSHDPLELDAMYKKINSGSDVVIGSRYLNGINVINWPLSRIILSKGASYYVKLITGIPISDPTSGFVGFKSKVLNSISLDKIKFIGYAFQIELKYKSWKKGFSLDEHSIIFKNRVKGKSKMNSSIIWEAIYGVLKLKFLKNF